MTPCPGERYSMGSLSDNRVLPRRSPIESRSLIHTHRDTPTDRQQRSAVGVVAAGETIFTGTISNDVDGMRITKRTAS